MNPLLSFIIILVGLYGMSTSKNIIKSVVCLTIIEAGTILFFLNLGNYFGGGIPIVSDGNPNGYVDPLPQALMITAIIIGSTITALSLMLSIKIFHAYGTLNWRELLDKEE